MGWCPHCVVQEAPPRLSGFCCFWLTQHINPESLSSLLAVLLLSAHGRFAHIHYLRDRLTSQGLQGVAKPARSCEVRRSVKYGFWKGLVYG